MSTQTLMIVVIIFTSAGNVTHILSHTKPFSARRMVGAVWLIINTAGMFMLAFEHGPWMVIVGMGITAAGIALQPMPREPGK